MGAAHKEQIVARNAWMIDDWTSKQPVYTMAIISRNYLTFCTHIRVGKQLYYFENLLQFRSGNRCDSMKRAYFRHCEDAELRSNVRNAITKDRPNELVL